MLLNSVKQRVVDSGGWADGRLHGR